MPFRPLLALFLLAALVPARGAAGRPLGPRAVNASAPAVAVSLSEFRLALSGAAVRAGRVSLEAIDRGRDPHDLRLRALGGGPPTAGPLLRPGGRWQTSLILRPGRYELWCSLPEHARLGMRATLRVVG